MDNNYKYYAFISYNREDEEWAMWLQHELEHFHLPDALKNRDDLPKEFHPVFRDVDELSAGELPSQIYNALENSASLIVICSPRAVSSKWVNKEISDFIEIGKTKGLDNVERIFPFMIEGVPNAQDEAQECFPESLRDKNLLAGNVNENGRDRAFVKVMAGMLPNVEFDDIWNRYERDKAEEERRKREERDKLLISQSRFVAEKAHALVEDGDSYNARRILLEVMPDDLENPDRPLVAEAESSLRGACIGNNVIFRGRRLHHQTVFSPDGKRIASASLEGHVDIWNMEDGSPMMHLEHAPCVMSIDFSPDGKFIATGASKPIGRIQKQQAPEGTIIIWDSETGEVVNTLLKNDEKQDVKSLAFSPDGKEIAAVVERGFVIILDIKNGSVVKKMKTPNNEGLMSVSYSPNGRQIVAASIDNSVIMWDIEKEDPLFVMKGHSDVVHYASFSPDGKRVASASMDQTIRIWDVSTGSLIEPVHHINGWANSVVFNPNNPNQVVFASPQEGVIVMDIVENLMSDGGKLGTVFATYSSDGRYVAAINVNESIQIYDTKEIIPRLEWHEEDVYSVAYSSDGKHVVSYSHDDVVRIWDVVTGKCVQSHKGCIEDIKQSVFNVDSSKIVLVSHEKDSVVIWEVNRNRKCLSFGAHESREYYAASFSPDGQFVVTVSNDRIVEIWDAQSGSFINDFEFPYDVCNAFFSPSGDLIATICNDVPYTDLIVIFDFNREEVVSTIQGESGEFITNSFSPDSKEFITVSNKNGAITIWDVKTGLVSKQLQDPDGIGFSDAAYSTDGKMIASTRFGSILIWDVENGIILHTLNDPASSVGFSKDGRCIVSSDDGGTIRIWDYPPLQDLIDQTRERFKNRPLTPEERRMYYLE